MITVAHHGRHAGEGVADYFPHGIGTNRPPCVNDSQVYVGVLDVKNARED